MARLQRTHGGAGVPQRPADFHGRDGKQQQHAAVKRRIGNAHRSGQQGQRQVQVGDQRRVRVNEVAARHRDSQEQLGLFQARRVYVRVRSPGHLPDADYGRGEQRRCEQDPRPSLPQRALVDRAGFGTVAWHGRDPGGRIILLNFSLLRIGVDRDSATRHASGAGACWACRVMKPPRPLGAGAHARGCPPRLESRL